MKIKNLVSVFVLLQITNEWLSQLVNSPLMDGLRDICLKNCKVSHEGLKNLNWKKLENINIIGVSIRGMFKFHILCFFRSLIELNVVILIRMVFRMENEITILKYCMHAKASLSIFQNSVPARFFRYFFFFHKSFENCYENVQKFMICHFAADKWTYINPCLMMCSQRNIYSWTFKWCDEISKRCKYSSIKIKTKYFRGVFTLQ